MRLPFVVAFSLLPIVALGQVAPERHLWMDARSFPPTSQTSQTITGKIALSGLNRFPADGGKMTITFQNGKSVTLTQVGASWRNWSFANPSEKTTAEVFKLSHDPGDLENGNSLCGSAAVYLTFSDRPLLQGKTLEMAVFSSSTPPVDILDKGLCGTFTYYDRAPPGCPTSPPPPPSSRPDRPHPVRAACPRPS